MTEKNEPREKLLILFALFSVLFLGFGIVSGITYAYVIQDRGNVIYENPQHVQFKYINSSLIYITFTLINPSHFNLRFTKKIVELLYYNNTSKSVILVNYSYVPAYIFKQHQMIIPPGKSMILRTEFKVNNVKVQNAIKYLVTTHKIQWIVRAEFDFVFANFPSYYSNPNYRLDPMRYYLTDLITMKIYYNMNTELMR